MGSWRYIEDHRQTATFGLATDEFLTNNYIDLSRNNHSATLRLYHYENFTALCGRFQDITAEIDLDFCKENGYTFSRRLTGGGAIIMGEDQLGICVSTNAKSLKWNRISDIYQMFAAPILSTLQELGISAQFRAKNDLEVSGKKIAGLGVYMSPEGAVQFHCSLLYDLDIPKMLELLNIPIQKYSDKAVVRSVEQRMTTVLKETPEFVDLSALREKLKASFSNYFDVQLETEPLVEDENDKIKKIEEEKYLNESWVFQHSPQDDMTGMSLKKTAGGLLRTYVGLKGENIKSVLITGDFMDKPTAFTEIESLLKWSVLDVEKISEVIDKVLQKEELPHNILKEEVLEAVWMAVQRAHAAHRYTYKGSCYYPKDTTAHV
ncbi:MAG: lipoate--protein ligase family protein [Cyclobacteriaceae bacterium]|nr:lipoate--protein ligase family protein [Cyclobacteriaceae bacterium]